MDFPTHPDSSVRRSLAQGVAFVLLLALSLVLVLALPLLPPRYELQVGDVAPRTIKSPRDVPPFRSDVLTNERKQRAAAAVSEILVFDATVAEQQLRRAQAILERMSQARERSGLSPEQRHQAIAAATIPPLSPEVAEYTARLDASQWQAVRAEVVRLLQEGAQKRIVADQLEAARVELGEQVRPEFDPDQAQVIRALALPLLQPNLSVDPAETERTRRLVMEQVEPISLRIVKGETIVRDGQIIGAVDLEKLQAAGLLRASVRWRDLVGTALIALALSLVLGIYLMRAQPTLLHSPRRLLLLALVVLGTALAAKVMLPGRPLWVYLFPLAAGPMLIATLLDATLAAVAGGVLSLLAAYLADYAPELGVLLSTSGLETLEKVAFYFAGSIVGILGIARARRVVSFFLAGSAVSLASVVTMSGFWLLMPERPLEAWGAAAVAALVNGLLAAAFTVGTFVVLGHLFGITTSIQLLELSQPDQPLLRQLLVEAPGTYYHSLLVGNLAERAAEAVGADPLLARVGAYYHDIGKVANPGFFIENQRTGDNPHDRLVPEHSAAMLIAHVRDGVRLARKHRLPAKIQDFITEHHGTRLALYFYHRAVERAGDPAAVDRAAFRYPGPRPQSKEAAVVMLADSVEAATRSLQHPTPADINALVDRIVAERVAEGQLDDSELTLRDLHRIREVFKDALQGIFHPRIAYPVSTYEPEPADVPAPERHQEQASEAPADQPDGGSQSPVQRLPFLRVLGEGGRARPGDR
ncbi:MAG: HDIG domain-containing protein [Chloroflexi bacterium]|nr:HDIG domain-containing protein [Chloroflexota bacterium]